MGEDFEKNHFSLTTKVDLNFGNGSVKLLKLVAYSDKFYEISN